jgi:hypothetical protein
MGWKWSQTLAGRGRIEYLWTGQEGRCTGCVQLLRPEEQDWHIHHRQWKSNGGNDALENLDLLHANCHRQIHAQPIADDNQPRPARGVGEGLSRMLDDPTYTPGSAGNMRHYDREYWLVEKYDLFLNMACSAGTRRDRSTHVFSLRGRGSQVHDHSTVVLNDSYRGCACRLRRH